MKKVLLSALLLTIAAPGQAAWVKIAWTSGATNYVDDASITRNGKTRQFLQLTDLKELHEKQFMSVRTQLEVDCDKRQVRSMGGKAFSEPMAQGKLVLEIPTSDWYDVPPRSAAELQLDFVCKT